MLTNQRTLGPTSSEDPFTLYPPTNDDLTHTDPGVQGRVCRPRRPRHFLCPSVPLGLRGRGSTRSLTLHDETPQLCMGWSGLHPNDPRPPRGRCSDGDKNTDSGKAIPTPTLPPLLSPVRITHPEEQSSHRSRTSVTPGPSFSPSHRGS